MLLGGEVQAQVATRALAPAQPSLGAFPSGISGETGVPPNPAALHFGLPHRVGAAYLSITHTRSNPETGEKVASENLRGNYLGGSSGDGLFSIGFGATSFAGEETFHYQRQAALALGGRFLSVGARYQESSRRGIGLVQANVPEALANPAQRFDSDHLAVGAVVRVSAALYVGFAFINEGITARNLSEHPRAARDGEAIGFALRQGGSRNGWRMEYSRSFYPNYRLNFPEDATYGTEIDRLGYVQRTFHLEGIVQGYLVGAGAEQIERGTALERTDRIYTVDVGLAPLRLRVPDSPLVTLRLQQLTISETELDISYTLAALSLGYLF